MWDSGSCDMYNNLVKQMAVSSLFSKVVPMLRTHAKGPGSLESWYAFERDRDMLSNLGKEDVRHSRLCSDSRVQINGVQAFHFFHNLPGDWNWWGSCTI